ncbi:MAG: site-specific integrase [Bacillota bacterium]|nr:site-specific integrase [Bacillota bacterium]
MQSQKHKARKDGRIRASKFIGYDKDGKEKRKYVYAHSEKELEKKMLDLNVNIVTGEFIEDDKITLGQWANLWYNNYIDGKGYKTAAMYKTAIDNHIIPEIGHMRLKDIKPMNLQGLLNRKGKEGLTRTQEIIRLTLKQMMDLAIENDYLVKNPAKKLKVTEFEKEVREPLTDTEMEIVEKANLTLKQKAFVYIGLYAGPRCGEILALTKNDIKGGVIKIRKTTVFKGNKTELQNWPKSAAGNRDIEIVDKLKTVLDEYVKTVKGIYLFQGEKKEGLMTQAAYRCMWDSIWKKCNRAAGGSSEVIAFRKITSHFLRHTFATMLYYAGVDMLQAQYLLGHESPDITMKIYTHLDKKKSAPTQKINLYLSSINYHGVKSGSEHFC